MEQLENVSEVRTMTFEERSAERRKRMVGNLAMSHQEAEEWDLAYWQSRTPEERLEVQAAINRAVEKVMREWKESHP